jgi:cell division septation protein DedD
LPQSLPATNPAPAGSAGQSPAVPPTPLPAPAFRTPSPTEEKQLRGATVGIDPAGGVAQDRPVPPPRASAAPRALAPRSTAATELPAAPPAAAQAPVQAPAAAKSRLAEGGGFVVQLSASKSEAGAQSTFRALKSKYAVLGARELVIRRKDQGKRGVSYAVQVGPFESRDDAEQLCEHLKAAGGSCFIAKN